VQMGMSLCGATHEAPGQLGVRTFRGPGDDVGGGFDGGPALDAQEEGPPPLGVTPDPKGALRAEARPMGIFDAVCRGVRTCHQRDGRARASFGSHHTKQKRAGSITSRWTHMQAAMQWLERRRVPSGVGRAPAEQPKLQSRAVMQERGRFQKALLGL
jgi:hypothetical protein